MVLKYAWNTTHNPARAQTDEMYIPNHSGHQRNVAQEHFKLQISNCKTQIVSGDLLHFDFCHMG
jgi:hypothetical protein